MATVGLTSEQEAVVRLEADARTLVTAPAGTGKTMVLIARVQHLIGTCGLSPGQEILVLSFTRSAVSLLRGQLLASGGDARYARATTFDSFATRVLSEFDFQGTWTGEEYDGRIRAATSLLNRGGEVGNLMSGFRHVLVDEVQDLVGERAEFVKAILLRTGGGFTLFGDPAQGIYSFQLEGEARLLGSQLLYRWIRERWGDDLHEATLTENFRALSADAQSVLWAGDELCQPTPAYDSIRQRLDTILLRMPSANPLGLAAKEFLRGGKKTAILTRTNGEALLISKALFSEGVPHRLQRLAAAQVVAPWLAVAFRGVPYQQVGRRLLTERVETLAAQGLLVPDPETAWRLLKRLDRRPHDSLLLPTVAAAIRTGAVPDELTEVPNPVITVSTIHRSKGMEFDRVVLVDFNAAEAEDDLTLAEETRVLYVGMTQPRQELLRLPRLDTRGMSSRRNPGERCVRRKAAWMTLEFEVRGNDAHSADPAGGFMFTAQQIAETQDYIQSSVNPGDELEVELLARSRDGTNRAFYSLRHRARVVGITSETFAELLYRTLKVSGRWKVTWPERLEGVHVECIDTVAGTEASSLRGGLGVSGMWLRVRPFGLAKLQYPRRV